MKIKSAPFTNVIPFVLLSLIFGGPAWGAPSADEILKKADEIRMPSGDYLLKVRAVSSRPGDQSQSATYEVLVKGAERTIIKTMAPATDRGTSLLMVDRDLWVFLPDVSKPVRISLQERLLGEVSNGDLARANFVGDYTAVLAATTAETFVLKLTGKTEDVTYGSVLLTIDRKTFRPLTAKFYAISGRLLKTGSYEGYREMAGAVRPTRLIFSDPLIKGKSTVLIYDDMAPQSHWPDKYFTKDYLKKLKY